MARVDVRAKPKKRAVNVVLPGDVQVLNGLASVLVLVTLGFLASSAWGVMKTSRTFALRSIEVANPLNKTSLSALRAVAAPRVAGNFFTVDMVQARAAFEAVPWVRRASVRRIWPSGLEVTIEEHRATAFWDGGEGDDRLVNEYGEVFDANLAEVEDDSLPMLGGPDGSSAQVLAAHQRLMPVLIPMNAQIESLRITRRGSWQAELNSGVVMELGRGNAAGDFQEVVERTARFVRTHADVVGRFGNPKLQHVDLRHGNGYALQLEGIELSVPGKPQQPLKKR